jgi:hypothetical protein
MGVRVTLGLVTVGRRRTASVAKAALSKRDAAAGANPAFKPEAEAESERLPVLSDDDGDGEGDGDGSGDGTRVAGRVGAVTTTTGGCGGATKSDGMAPAGPAKDAAE